MNQLKKFIDLLIYGNFWIALGALCMSLQSAFLFKGTIQLTPLYGFIFFATLLLYALHRIIGIKEMTPFRAEDRFRTSFKFKRHIILYGILAGISSLVLFFFLRFPIQLLLLPGAVISLGYVLPFFKQSKRLRDINYIKIFLIAISWAWITAVLPAADAKTIGQSETWILFAERFFFLLAITLPFDIRDLKVDAHTQLKTLPSLLGQKNTRILMIVSLLAMAVLSGWNYLLGFYSIYSFLAILLSSITFCPILLYSNESKHDYYFSGLIDGMMILQFLMIWVGNLWNG